MHTIQALAFIQNLGAVEIIIVLVVALLLFGRKLPEVARNLGKGITEFKRGIHDAGQEVKKELNEAADMTEREKVKEPSAPTVQAQEKVETPEGESKK